MLQTRLNVRDLCKFPLTWVFVLCENFLLSREMEHTLGPGHYFWVTWCHSEVMTRFRHKCRTVLVCVKCVTNSTPPPISRSRTHCSNLDNGTGIMSLQRSSVKFRYLYHVSNSLTHVTSSMIEDPHSILDTHTPHSKSISEMWLCVRLSENRHVRETQNCRDKTLWFFFFDFLVLSGVFGKQSLRFRTSITFFFGILIFLYPNKDPVDHMIEQFRVSLNTGSQFFSDMLFLLWRRKRGLRGQEGTRCIQVYYYESMKRKPKIKPIYECRCNGRLQTKRFTRLAHTGCLWYETQRAKSLRILKVQLFIMNRWSER